MLIELAKRLNEVDDDLSLLVKSDGNRVELSVYSDNIGTIYSFSTTYMVEAYKKIEEFIDCLKSPDKFDKLVKDILTLPIEE